MPYQWINIEEAWPAKGKNIILFGAGKGSEEFIHYTGKAKLNTPIEFIVDNDKSLHGKRLFDYRVCPPESINRCKNRLVVVTSVSGRDAISRQLMGMGQVPGRDYILVGTYPQGAYLENYKGIRENIGSVEGRALHIGPGGFLGLETLLMAQGCSQVVSVDKHSFGMVYPDITSKAEAYARVQTYIESKGEGKKDLDRFDALFFFKNGKRLIDRKKIEYQFPMDLCSLSFEDQTFDAVFSFAVLEHVNHPQKAVAQVARVMKKGAVCLHKIVTTDHRSFSGISGYGPFSFRRYSHENWADLTRNKFFQNRVLPAEWKRLFEENGLKIRKYGVGRTMDLKEDQLEGFSEDFAGFTKKELGEIDCTIVAEKI